MAGRLKPADKRQLASNRQLWRLNTLGRLTLTEGAKPISSSEASSLIAAAAAELEFTIFPSGWLSWTASEEKAPWWSAKTKEQTGTCVNR